MTKSRPPAPPGRDAMLQRQARETAKLRAARDERRATSGEPTPKRYRLASPNPDGTIAIDVADRDLDNWRQREMCPNLEAAQRRLRQLTGGQDGFIP